QSSRDPQRMGIVLRLSPGSPEELLELVEGSLRRRRAFVAEAESFPPTEAAATRERCELIVDLPSGRTATLEAEIVFVEQEGPGRGVGLTLVARDLEVALKPLVDALFEAQELEPVADAELANDEPHSSRAQEDARVRNIHERVRKLSVAERERMARSGGMSERVALERAYGSAVWEGLLQNPQLTGGEIARIAKNGTAPTPILALIAMNVAWVARGEVRRALLGNPRLGAPVVEKVLRAAPKAEIKLI